MTRREMCRAQEPSVIAISSLVYFYIPDSADIALFLVNHSEKITLVLSISRAKQRQGSTKPNGEGEAVGVEGRAGDACVYLDGVVEEVVCINRARLYEGTHD